MVKPGIKSEDLVEIETILEVGLWRREHKNNPNFREELAFALANSEI
jgi:hypothetical protein